MLSADGADAKAGLKGNLIVDVFREVTPETKPGEPKPAARRTPLGLLPALPFEVVAGSPAPKP